MYYTFAILYCMLACVVALYAIIWNKTLGNEPLGLSEETLAGDQTDDNTEETTLEADTRLFLMSQSKINDIFLYIPAALQGILYIIHMREIESAFIDSAVAAEHNQLLPPSSTDYIGFSGPGPYTQTPQYQDSKHRSEHNDNENGAKFTNQLTEMETDDYMQMTGRSTIDKTRTT